MARADSGAGATPEGLRERLYHAGYIADEDLASLVWMGLRLERPLLLEGDAGVGKTAVAGACARALGRPLLRLQCYEGLDLSQAVYEWNYSRQLLEIRLAEAGQGDRAALRDNLFSEAFLLERPLLQAIRSPQPCVLLIDEIDRADEAFEAFLLEMLSEYQVTVPEIGTLAARSKPLVVLTSNGTRDLSDALRRRCLFHYLDFPSLAREMQIVRTLVPEAAGRLVEQAVAFVQRLRRDTAKFRAILYGLGKGAKEITHHRGGEVKRSIAKKFVAFLMENGVMTANGRTVHLP